MDRPPDPPPRAPRPRDPGGLRSALAAGRPRARGGGRGVGAGRRVSRRDPVGPVLAAEIRRREVDVVVSTTRLTSRSPVLPRGWRGGRAPSRINSGWNPREQIVNSGWRWRRRRWYHRHLVQLAATNSQAGRADLVARDYLPPERIVPIYSGVDFSRFDPEHVERGAFRAELGIPRTRRSSSRSRYCGRRDRSSRSRRRDG